ncbi:hypothetical protein [Parasitella parasitica]|uniref:Uncharacterized protein n=1 Tax=Parasitella parasitica TaxID=35722 RepID=A0A0B7MP31_9FUNG|nr:hypothetical protein [Parasitella parasitica]
MTINTRSTASTSNGDSASGDSENMGQANHHQEGAATTSTMYVSNDMDLDDTGTITACCIHLDTCVIDNTCLFGS